MRLVTYAIWITVIIPRITLGLNINPIDQTNEGDLFITFGKVYVFLLLILRDLKLTLIGLAKITTCNVR